MPVFKLCLKILKQYIPVMLIYFGIFIMVSLILMSSASSTQGGYRSTKADVAIISDENTVLIDGLKTSLADVANFVELADDENQIQDALYFRRVGYVLRIPSGFSEAFMAGQTPTLLKTVVPGSFSNQYIDMNIEQYLNTARLYVNAQTDISMIQVTEAVLDDLAQRADVQMMQSSRSYADQGMMQYYFNYLAYTFMFVMILGISTIMLVFNNIHIKRRNACGPLAASTVNVQFYLANMVFTLISWVSLVTLSLAFGYKEVSNSTTLYFILNSLLFAITVSGISFLIGNLIKGRQAISAVANIFTLGTCFISGVFVPQVLLSEAVLRVASFFPTYWYVLANAQIASMVEDSNIGLNALTSTLFIQVGFALAFFIIAMAVGKHRHLSLEES